MGRPRTFDREKVMKAICAEISQGRALARMCEENDEYPTTTTIWEWLDADPALAAMYARARQEQADYMADQIVEIADTCEDPQKARLQVDARKWVAAKLKPRKYGDKVAAELSGPDGGPIEVAVELGKAERDRLAAAVLRDLEIKHDD